MQISKGNIIKASDVYWKSVHVGYKIMAIDTSPPSSQGTLITTNNFKCSFFHMCSCDSFVPCNCDITCNADYCVKDACYKDGCSPYGSPCPDDPCATNDAQMFFF